VLIAAGVDLTLTDDANGESLMTIAVAKQNWDAATRLLALPSAPEMLKARDQAGWTCLHHALRYQRIRPSQHFDTWRKQISSIIGENSLFMEAEAAVESTATKLKAEGHAKLENFRGPVGDVTVKEAGFVVFRRFSTVRAPCFCPVGSKAYFEVEVLHDSIQYPQWGFATRDFEPTDTYTGNGVGDDSESWGFDGSRRKVWYKGKDIKYSGLWRAGDVIGLACYVNDGPTLIQVSVNGEWMESSLELPSGLSGLYPALTAQRATVRVNLTGNWRFGPPGDDFVAIGSFGECKP